MIYGERFQSTHPWGVGVDFDDLRGKVSEYSSLGGTTLVMCSNKSFAIYD
jgi:hypothetical protein